MSESNDVKIEEKVKADPRIKALFETGLHFGYSKSKRHPTMAGFVFGLKNRVEIIDLEKTEELLKKAKIFAENLGKTGRKILFVSSKGEAEKIIKTLAEEKKIPYVVNRWLGGTLTNFPEISQRTKKLIDLREKKTKGELVKYTKKERLMIDRDIERLEGLFGGLLPLNGSLPGALFVIDPKKEKTATAEAKLLKIPIIGLMNTDNNLKDADFPIVGNDSSCLSIELVISEISSAFEAGLALKGKV